MPKSIGLSVHWTTQSTDFRGERLPYGEMVEGFDVPRFVDALCQAGADHCIFTLTHAEQYLACPCAALEKILPGRVTRRDLLFELAQALHRENIRLIAYYNHSCNDRDDLAWKAACGYANGPQHSLDRFANNIIGIVGDVARHLGDALDGWWFDSASTIDPSGPRATVSCAMGAWRFPWDALVRAAKSGNPDCAVAINAGVGYHHMYTALQEYAAGESVRLDEPFTPDPADGLVDHRWITADNADWVFMGQNGSFASTRFGDDDVRAFVRRNIALNRMTTFNMEIDRSGALNPASLDQFRRVKAIIEKERNK